MKESTEGIYHFSTIQSKLH